MGILYGRAGRLTAENGGFRPGQKIIRKIVPAPFYNEDPHVYRNRRGEFHMLAHSLCLQWPHCTDVGGHASSADGIHWVCVFCHTRISIDTLCPQQVWSAKCLIGQ